MKTDIPPDVTLTHITVNTGHSARVEVFTDKRPVHLARVAAHFKPLLDTGLAPVYPGLGAGLLDCTDFGPHCAAWFLYPEKLGKRNAAITCFASTERNPQFFERAVNLAREQFTSMADQLLSQIADNPTTNASPSDLDDSFLAPFPTLKTPEPPWLATVLHVPFGTLSRDIIDGIPDINQCLAAAALHYPIQ